MLDLTYRHTSKTRHGFFFSPSNLSKSSKCINADTQISIGILDIGNLYPRNQLPITLKSVSSKYPPVSLNSINGFVKWLTGNCFKDTGYYIRRYQLSIWLLEIKLPQEPVCCSADFVDTGHGFWSTDNKDN